MQSFDFKKFMPHIIVIGIFLAVALIFGYPQLEGKILFQSDNVSWKSSAREGMDYHEKTGENVLWSNSMFGGMPSYTFYVPEGKNYVFYIQRAVDSLLGKPTSFLFMAMLCFYILMSVLKIERWIGVAASATFALATYNIVLIDGGHDTQVQAIGYMPAVIAGLLLLYRSKWWAGIPLLGLAVTLLISTGHYQVVYYTIFVIIFFTIGQFVIAVREKTIPAFFKSSVVALLIAVAAVGTNMAGFLATLEYGKHTMRGGRSELTINQHDADKKSGGLDKEYAFRWSNDIGETFSLMIPYLYGGASSQPLGTDSKVYEKLTEIGVPEENAEQIITQLPTYWGPQPFIGGPIYFGAIVCFLFILGISVVRSPHKWWILAACILSIVMSWGNHFPAFNYFLFDTIPMLNNFRVPNMILVIAQFLFPVLGAWALNDIVKDKISSEELWKKVRLSVIITAGLCVVLGLGGSAFFSFKSQQDAGVQERFAQALQSPEKAAQLVSALHEDRASMAMKSSLTSALYILLAGGLLWAYSRKKIKGQWMVVGIGALAVIDLISVDTNYLKADNFVDEADYQANFEPRPVDAQIMQDKDPYYRVLDVSKNTYNDASQANFHKCIGGYSPAKMEIYQDMIDVHLGGQKGYNQAVLNMLNTKYVIFNGNNNQPAAMPNPNACGNGWFVDEVKWVNSADSEILSLKAPLLGDTTQVPDAFDPKKTAVIRNTFKKDLEGYNFGKDSAAKISLTKYGLNDLAFTSQNSKDGLAVFADIYYAEGWKAYVDGKETPIVRANYILRAIKIPKGEHKVEFKFHPDTYYTGDKIAMISSLLLILVCGVSVFKWVKDEKEGTA